MLSSNRPQLVLLATTYAPDCDYVIDKYLDGYYTLQFMESGGVALAYDDREFTMEGAWFWPAYPGPHIKFHAAAGYETWCHRHIGFRGPLVERWIAAGIWPWDPQPAPAVRNYSVFFDDLIHLAKRTDSWAWLRAVNMLEQLLIELAEAREGGNTNDPWADDVMKAALSERSFSPDYTLLARRFGMGLSTLRRRFRKSTGLSLHQWVVQMRMAEAQTLLADSDLSIKNIAAELGYDNVYFFSRQFHECCGASPTAYRNSRLREPVASS
jgi:AraC-like DNA-binding protein